MTTKRLPGYLLKAVPNIALASTDYLSAYASLMLQSIDTDDGPIADARAQLILLNERLEVEVAKRPNSLADDYYGLLGSLLSIRSVLSQDRPGPLAGETVTDDFDRLLCVVDAMAEVARRAAGRECAVKKIACSEAA